MGKNKDKKKKGLGMEKTMAKTEKKLKKSLKKELDENGEEDIEKLLQAFLEKEKESSSFKEEILSDGNFPSRRGGATLNLLPERNELVLFGGEFYDGHKVKEFNDLFVFNLKKSQWTRIKAPKGPPPRHFHQAVTTSRNKGELWIFGGEFSSPSQSQFYHYNDLWMFNFGEKKWTQFKAPNGPSPRSGHRMVLFKKYLVVFGGYYDNLRNCRFFHDTHLFNIETSQWEEMKFVTGGQLEMPSPRSACHMMVCNKKSSIVIYGGFSKEKVKRENEKGIIHSDMFELSCELKKNDKLEWKWRKVRQAGLKPSERISSSMITTGDDTAFLFGGVFDLEVEDESEEDVDDDDENGNEDDNDDMYEDNVKPKSVFFNDFYKLDLVNFKWSCVNLKGKKEKTANKTKKASKGTSVTAASNNDSNAHDEDDGEDSDGNDNDDQEDENNDENNNEHDDEKEKKNNMIKSNESAMSLETSLEQIKLDEEDEEEPVFKITYASKSEENTNESKGHDDDTVSKNESLTAFVPMARRSSYLQFHKGILYMYGGKYEDKYEKEYTFNDMFSLNTKKMDEWKIMFEDAEINSQLNKKGQAAAYSDSDDMSDDDDDDNETNEED